MFQEIYAMDEIYMDIKKNLQKRFIKQIENFLMFLIVQNFCIMIQVFCTAGFAFWFLYLTSLVHLYDTATDLFIIIDWSIQAWFTKKGEDENPHLNMQGMALAALAAFLSYCLTQ